MPKSTAFIAARVANAEVSGWLPDHAVLVDSGRITAVTPVSQLPSDVESKYTVLDMGDVSLLPGLCDAHCHMHCSATPDAQQEALTEKPDKLLMRATDAMRRILMSGTTTVRDIGARNDVSFSVLGGINSGAIPGPRLICTGTPITITAGHCWFFGTEADTTEEVVHAVRRQVKLGARAIKMMSTGGMFTPTANPRLPQYDVDTLRAAVYEAERLNVQIVAHTLSAQGTRNCVEAGIHHLIHARWLDRDPTKKLAFDPQVADQMAENGQWVDPTIGHHLLGVEARAAQEDTVPKTPWSMQQVTITEEEHLETLQGMINAGVRFTAGLDMGMPYADHAKSGANAWAYHEWLGWDTWRAIRANTADTAEALLLGDEVGRIEPGKIADLAAFRGDPAANIRQLVNAATVVQGGNVVKLNGESLV